MTSHSKAEGMLLRSHASRRNVNPSRGSAGRAQVSPVGRQLWGEPDPQLGDLAARQVAVDLAGDVALQDSDDVTFGAPFLHPALEVEPCFWVMGNADHDNAPQSAVRLAVATAVKSEMSRVLPRVGRNG